MNQVSGTAPSAQSRAIRQPSTLRNVLVMSVAAGMFATVALPAYSNNTSFSENSEITQLTREEAQAVEVDASAVVSGVSTERYSASTRSEYARTAANAQMSAYARSYTGPSVEELLANPPYSEFDGEAIYQAALALQGTPYVYGGDTPAGFDCSGYVQYVFAQFGVALPHSSGGQAARGKRISEADARPGDLVIMPGHDGFWAGPGLILHSPFKGSTVRIQEIWTSYYIVRLGI